MKLIFNKVEPASLRLCLLSMAVLLLYGCYGSTNIGNEELNYIVDDKTLDKGKSLYQVYCYSCHGVDLKGTGPEAAKQIKPPADLTEKSLHMTQRAIKFVLDYPHYSHEAVQDAINYGNEVMPPLKDVLKRDEVEAITQYIITSIRSQDTE